MAISAAYEGSASISTTEYSLPNAGTTLTPITADGVYQLFLDLNALAAGDLYELRLYEKVQSAGTQRLCEMWIFDGAQGHPHHVSPAFVLLHGWDMTMKKGSGTDRTIGWSIRQLT
jgi:ATP phosphoribosyltransferase regulatory subunit HisZ